MLLLKTEDSLGHFGTQERLSAKSIAPLLHFRTAHSRCLVLGVVPSRQLLIVRPLLAPEPQLAKHRSSAADCALVPSWVVRVPRILLTNTDEIKEHA